MMFDVLTLFPKMFDFLFLESIISKAIKKEIIKLNVIDIRDFSKHKNKNVDDYPYGGGPGMIMQAEPIFDAYEKVCKNLSYKPITIYLSPKGKLLNQKDVMELSNTQHLVLICGHYEGVDQRVIDEIVDLEISLGDYILTGGEIAAMAVIDSVSRIIPGVLKTSNSVIFETFNDNLLEHPQYTRPRIWKNREVPSVLLNGNHKEIEIWRRQQSILLTQKRRKDLLKNTNSLPE